MRVRTYGLIALAAVGFAPLICYGYLAAQRSQETSIASVREGNQHLARAVAETIRLHIEHQHQMFATLGVTVLQSADRRRTLALFELDPTYDHLDDVVVYEVRGDALQVVAGVAPGHRDDEYRARAEHCIESPGQVPATRLERVRDTHSMQMVQPIIVAGAVKGAVVGRYDLVGIWRTLEAVQAARTKYARLISASLETIAHGDPNSQPDALAPGRRHVSALVDAAADSSVNHNSRGQEIVVTVAMVAKAQSVDACRPIWQRAAQVARGRDAAPLSAAQRQLEGGIQCWQVLVEQTVEEAFAATVAMKWDLALVGIGVLLLVAVVGMALGRSLIRALERVRAHTGTLSSDLTSRFDYSTRLVEVQALADALDQMAAALYGEREEAKRRARLATFARVAAGLAHDLRLPIEAVRGACDMVNASPDDEGAQEFLRKVSEREMPRLKRFVDDLQRLARSGRIGAEREVVQPEDIARQVHEELVDVPKWHGVQFEVAGTGQPIALDRDLIRRAVLNLAGNGADACLQKGLGNRVTIEVSDVAEGAAVEYRVSDTGVGMTEERLAALEHGDFQSSKRSNGVGLGLGVARQIAATHDGTLRAESVLGQGSVFALRVPRREPGSRA